MADTKPIKPSNHVALVLSIVKETEPGLMCYSDLEENGLMLAIVPQYNDYL